MRLEHKKYSSRGAQKMQQQKKQQTEPQRETQNQREIHRVILCEGKRVSGMDTMSRIETLCREVWSQGETGEDIYGEADEDI